MRITINERKHAALSRKTASSTRLPQVRRRHNRVTTATHDYPIGVPLAPPTHTFRATNSPLQSATPRHGQPNSSTHWHHNPHTTTINPLPHQHGAHTPPPTPNRPTLQPHSTPSGQADSAHQTENSLKLPVVGSQHTESEILPGAAG